MIDPVLMHDTHGTRESLELAHPDWNWLEARLVTVDGYQFRQSLHAKLIVPDHDPSHLCSICLAAAEETMIALRPQVADLVIETIREGMKFGGKLDPMTSRQIQKDCFRDLYDVIFEEASPKIHSRLELEDHYINERCEICMQAVGLSIRFFVPKLIDRHITTVHSLFGWRCPSIHQYAD